MKSPLGQQTPVDPDIIAIGASMTTDRGASQGMATIRPDLAILERTMSTNLAGLDVLTALATRLDSLGSVPSVPTATRVPRLLQPDPAATEFAADRAPNPLDNGEASYAKRDRPGSESPTRPRVPWAPWAAAALRQAALLPDLPALSRILPDLTDATQTIISSTPISPTSEGSVAAEPAIRATHSNIGGSAALRGSPLIAVGTQFSAAPLQAVRGIAPSVGIYGQTTALADPAAPRIASRGDPSGSRVASSLARLATGFAPDISTASKPLAPMIDIPEQWLAQQQEALAPSGNVQIAAAQDGSPPNARYWRSAGNRLARSQSRSPETTQNEPQRGVIILDGAQLGRWVVDRLSREASRPIAGTTGIDPRITPTFPGAPASA